MICSTSSSHQGKGPDEQTNRPLPSPSCALQPLNSQQLTSEQNLQPSTSEHFNRQDVGTPPQWHHEQQSSQHPNQYYNSEPRQHCQFRAGSPPQIMLYFIESSCSQPPPQRTDPEVHQSGSAGLIDKSVRTKFVRKVYVILVLQLLFTMGIIALFIFEPNVKQFVRRNTYLVWMAFVLLVSVYMGLGCSTSMSRNSPYNVSSLVVLTLAMSYLAGTASASVDTEGVLMVVGICAAVFIAVSIFSYYTKFDFTSCLGALGLLGMILLGFGIIAIFHPVKIMAIIYAAFGAVVFSLYLTLHTQILLGGRKYELSLDEYVYAAILIYVDVIAIFLHLFVLILPSKR